jgi:transposase
MINNEGQSVTDVSQKIGLHIKTLYRWLMNALEIQKVAVPLYF